MIGKRLLTGVVAILFTVDASNVLTKEEQKRMPGFSNLRPAGSNTASRLSQEERDRRQDKAAEENLAWAAKVIADRKKKRNGGR